MKVSILTLGCRVNSYESDAMAGLLRSRGFEIVPENDPANICIVNTCTVTNIADRKSRQMISKCRRLNPDAKIIVTGCWSQRYPEAASALPGVSAVLGSSEKNRIAEVVSELLEGGSHVLLVEDVMHKRGFEEMSATAEGRTRAYLKIQDGCNRFCSYCAIPYARGAVRSRSLSSVRRELELLEKAGFAEVVFTGIHLTDYGKDIGGVDLADAVDCAEGLDGIKRIRLGSLEPHGLTDEMISRITSCGRVCRQFHLSLQSGSTTVLQRMRRGYTADEYAEIVEKIRSSYGPERERVAVTTDVIAGFAGETEEEHLETIDFMKRIGFARVHVFPYSRRSGTLADRMPGQLTNAEKSARAQELISVGRLLERTFLERFIGRTERVLIESKHDGGLYFGFTDSYVRVLTADAEPNTFADVNIRSITEDKNGELSLLSDNCRRDTFEQGL
ncbi:MAG: tRNA (N(6)-L-threonylcarbamoyladenosine(37)-C(2))-methylthiotransferase MtaB [Clostridia bacterium]|nr:tRNA (N(6)-L-threonylcarbamoyladenosine(37)-C(2))-methylthiotransferase MtaB [Clostridia bacterium]